MLLRQTISQLLAHPLRTILTLSGIILGVGMIILVTSLIDSAGQALQQTSQEASGDNHLEVQDKWGSQRAKLAPAKLLDREDLAMLRQSQYFASRPDVSFAANLQANIEVAHGLEQINVRIVGLTPSGLKTYNISIAQGRFYSDLERRSQLRVGIIGSKLFKKLLDGQESQLGQKELTLANQPYRVVGVLQAKPAMGGGGWEQWDTTVIIPDTTFLTRFRQNSQALDSIFLFTNQLKGLKQWLGTYTQVARSLLLNPRQGVENFKIDSPLDDDKARSIMLIVVVLLVGIAVVALFVGGINVMNILLVSVNERMKEIGLMRALGATQGQIFRQFLLESVLVAGLGGLAGLLGGICFSFLIALGIHHFVPLWEFTLTWHWVFLSLGFALLTGVTFGIYPAYRAAHFQPVECLRTE